MGSPTTLAAVAGATVLGLMITPVVLVTGAVQPAVASLCAAPSSGWAAPVSDPVTVRFGQSVGGRPATGIRYASPAQTVVAAVASGTVTKTTSGVVEVTHTAQLVTRYTGVTTALTVGTVVNAGQPLGTTSRAGMVFTVLVGGTPVDPFLYLADPTRAGEGPDAVTSAQAAVRAARAAAAAGFPRRELVTAVAVAGAESSWRPDATHLNRNGSSDYGLWQINSVHADLLKAGNWRDPGDNAVMAVKVWRMQGWGAWTTHDSGDYTRFLNIARMAVAQLADDDSVPGAQGTPGTEPGDELASFNCGQGEASTGGRSTDTMTCTTGADDGVDDGPDGARIRLCTIDGITVDVTLAPKLAQLLAAAAAAGIDLGGSGYRSHARQIELRRAHCGSTAYDIWERPSRQCSPPTAVPGKSMHEWGLAIDFTTRGAGTLTRSSPGFVWLSANAGRFGLKNLPSEPWHWSTNGH